jgi:prolipoprotein diacylglyceryltransferase
VLFYVGSVAVRWYGLMYLVGYVVGYRIVRARIGIAPKRMPFSVPPPLERSL